MSNNALDSQATREGAQVCPNSVLGVHSLPTSVHLAPFSGCQGSIDCIRIPWLTMSRNATPLTSIRSRKEPLVNYTVVLVSDFRVVSCIPNAIDEN